MKRIETYIIGVLLLFAISSLYADTPQSHNARGKKLGENKLYNEATAEFDKAISAYDDAAAKAYHNRGWAQELAGNYPEAIESYEAALVRNPSQIISGEKLGFLYYQAGDYINAVRVGENVIRLDPDNKPVKQWLPDAYMKKLEQEKLAEKESKKDCEEEEEAPAEMEQEEDGKRHKLFVTFGLMARGGYFWGDSPKLQYISDEGGIVNIPQDLDIVFTPLEAWSFRLYAGNPFLGASIPNVLIHNETFEGQFLFGDYSVGLGIMFNHHRSSLSFNKNLSLWDWKTGFIFGFEKPEQDYRVTMRWYPRLFPRDGQASKKQTFDVSLFRLDYEYEAQNTMSFYSVLQGWGFYIFDHSSETSNYWGVYDMTFGVMLKGKSKSENSIPLKLSFDFTERLYLRDLDNSSPYSVGNGQGFFGVNIAKWLKGAPFSGIRSLAQVLSGTVYEGISDSIWLYQRLALEVSSAKEDHHELDIEVGVEASF